ncbi:MAG: GNAT family N-acetyltransferase [Pseudomonadota bacterium]|jgi:GNAT superfamily N-acetyltransferase|uniref:Acetyltransferase (GNAT) family protein n=1 Tax=Marisediminitalea aggregata TaxID=634436 RepID=A0A1M5GVU7_9ALTE|nr:GNAT family N-acetyltransferase [Marisediminitalea aggregata]MAP23422.1 N-acetyltransferase [Alteromonadaceae bacterium]MCP3865943.1 GNAT family N-acetyltransferase [Aestuariibacter sp.]MEC7451597.1 GNAT family N-acetyltransferase [Pseudomonadota bacterium]BBO28719.1 N-acetyltransferase GCN5 [Alteromonas sp. I4]HBY37894.1 N-acetyltransferase [Alteromonas sp.]|tara:strand:- start:853 stop:1491 length:639 start_codon:yes stop_codon:yes gene_type:complete
MVQADTSPQLDSVRAAYLSAEDLKVAASIIYNAYHDDPIFLEIFQSEREGYESRLRSAIREELTAFWEADQPIIGLFDEGRLLAVACLTSPDNSIGAGRYWHWRLKMLLTTGYYGTRQMLEKEEKIRNAMPAQKYHLLSFIAVHPDHQSHGLGHLLMRAIDSVLLEHRDSEGVGVFVTVPKYESFFADGFYQNVAQVEITTKVGNVMFRPRP